MTVADLFATIQEITNGGGTENQTAAVSAGEIRSSTEADWAKEDADAKFDAAQETPNGVADLICVCNVASIGIDFLVTTTATGYATGYAMMRGNEENGADAAHLSAP